MPIAPKPKFLPSGAAAQRMARSIVWLGAVCVCGISLGLASVFLYLDPLIPPTETYRHYAFETPLRIYTADGKLIGEFGDRRLVPIALEDVPPHFINALLDTEDKRFYRHAGVDLISLANDLASLPFSDVRTGASTITMQLAKVVSFTHEQVFIRKFKEILLALKVEQELSKEQILELYVNVMAFGKHAYGVQAAAHTYYGKPVGELALAQLAMLAGILKKPEGGNPINGPAWALKRRNLVLRRMLAQGSIGEAEYREAVAAPITARVFARGIDLPAPYPAEWVRRELFRRYGSAIYSGFIAHTTLDSARQAAAQRALAQGLVDYDRRHGYRGAEGRVGVADAELTAAQLAGYRVVGALSPAAVAAVHERSINAVLPDARTVTVPWQGLRWARRFLTVDSLGPAPERAADIVEVGDVVRVERIDGGWRLAQLPEVQGALVALDPRTGGVEALVGGWDFHAQQFDHARQTSRQPGSGFKPVVYSAALERGVNPASIFWDSPLVLRDASGEATYRPRNDSNDYRGPMPLRQALYQSRNVVSIRVLLRTGLQRSLAHAARFGFERDALPRNTQLAIGGGNIEVAPIDMAATYAVFANGGFLVEPHILSRVERLDGSTVLAPRHPRACDPCPAQDGAEAPPAAPRAISARNAFVMDSMLRDVIRRGTGRRARALGRPDIAGKTGTLDDATDTWFNGYHPNLVAVAWVGFSDRRPMGAREWGSTAALPVWIGFMREALAGEPVIDPLVPEGVVGVKVDPATGQVAGADLPNAVFEYFYAEHVPAQARPGTRAARIETPGHVRPEDIF